MVFSKANDLLLELLTAISTDEKIKETSVDTNYAMLKAEMYLADMKDLEKQLYN